MECVMPWIADPDIPPCPCGAGREHQQMGGGARPGWECLVCRLGRTPPEGWTCELREVTDGQLAAMNARQRRLSAERAAMEAERRQRKLAEVEAARDKPCPDCGGATRWFESPGFYREIRCTELRCLWGVRGYL